MSTPDDKKNIPWSGEKYKRRIKALRRHFTGYTTADGFDLRKDPFKSLTQYQRSKIRKQWDYLNEIMAGVPKRQYRPKDKRKIKQVLRSQGYDHVPKNLKAAYLPDLEREMKVKTTKAKKITGKDNLTNKNVTLVELAPVETFSMGVKRRYIFVNPEYLLDDPLGAVNDMMELAGANFYTIQAGVHEITSTEFGITKKDTPEDISKKLDRLMKKYGNPEENNYYKNWLGGLVAYYYPKDRAANYDMYQNRVSKRQRENRDSRKAIRTLEKKLEKTETAIDNLGERLKELLEFDVIFRRRKTPLSQVERQMARKVTTRVRRAYKKKDELQARKKDILNKIKKAKLN